MRQVFGEWEISLGTLPRTEIFTDKENTTFDAVILLSIVIYTET